LGLIRKVFGTAASEMLDDRLDRLASHRVFDRVRLAVRSQGQTFAYFKSKVVGSTLVSCEVRASGPESGHGTKVQLGCHESSAGRHIVTVRVRGLDKLDSRDLCAERVT
jgi:hypothetical protein